MLILLSWLTLFQVVAVQSFSTPSSWMNMNKHKNAAARLDMTVSSQSQQQQQRRRVAVIGATGRLGREAVQQLIARGVDCNILIRKLPRSMEHHDANNIVQSPPGVITKESTKEDVILYFMNLGKNNPSGASVTAILGDVTNGTSLEELLQGCEACLALYGATRRSKISDLWTNPEDTDPTHAKQVNYHGVINLIKAAQSTINKSTTSNNNNETNSSGCRRIVRITGKGEDPNGFFAILLNMLGSMAKAWNYQGELVLRNQTDIDYTIIRPGIMSEEGPPKTNKDDDATLLCLADNGGDLPVTRISYADIASLSIDCLDYPNTAQCTLTAMTTTAPSETAVTTTSTTPDSFVGTTAASTSFVPLLPKVQPDRRVFPTNMLEQHYAAVKNTLIKIGVVLILIMSLALYNM